MRMLRLFIFNLVLISAFVLVATSSTSAAGTQGRNFAFMASANDVLKVVLLESNDPQEYVEVVINGVIFGINESEGNIVNGHWTYEKPLGEDFSIPDTPVPVRIALGVWGEVSLNGVKQSTTDAQFLSAVNISSFDASPAGSGTRLTMIVEVDNAALFKWVTKEYVLSTNNLTRIEQLILAIQLFRLETFENLDGPTLTLTDHVTPQCSGGRWFDLIPRLTFGPGNQVNGSATRIVCP